MASAATIPNTGKALRPDIQRAVARVTEISSLPEITTRIVQVVEDPKASARDMHDIVRTDPALAAKILKVVNSAFYGLPAQIGSLERAILMLGLSAVKNIALAASLSRMFKADAVSEQFAARDLWRHCVAVGVCARQVATVVRFPQVDEVFVAGLVHDLGLIISQQVFPAKLREAADICFNAPQNFCAVEERIVGADHQALGGALAQRWKFPAALRHAMCYHHDPQSLQPDFRRLASMVYIADTICSQARYGFWLSAQTQPLDGEPLVHAGLEPAQIPEITENLTARVEEAEQIFSGD